MKKRLVWFLLMIAILGAVFSLSSCVNTLSEGEIHIVATHFAGYDLAAEVVGRDNTRVSVEFLSAGDSHSFNPTFGDIAKIENADLFIYVGGESDSAIDALLKNVGDVNCLKMIDCVPLLEAEDRHEHEEGEEHHEHPYDEHVWTSPYHAAEITEAICEAISAIDPDYAGDYRQNADRCKEALLSLDRDFEELFALYENPTLVFGDRFPFLYFAHRYGVSYHAAFPGCSSASEPSPHTVIELVDMVKKEKISTVFHIESGTHEVAEHIASEGGAKTALLHSCHKVSPDEIKAGTTYLSLMRDNYLAIKKALEK